MFNFNTKPNLKDVVSKTTKQNNAIKALKERNEKEEFIKQFGIQIDMPANYVFGAMFFRSDPNYIVVANRQTFPTSTKFYNFESLSQNAGQGAISTDFETQKQTESQSLCLKVYKNVKGTYTLQHTCQADPTQYKQNNIALFSDQGSKIAMIREEVVSKQSSSLAKKLVAIDKKKEEFRYAFDIFDCSSIEYILSQDILSQHSNNLECSINDPQLSQFTASRAIYMRFSESGRYFYVIKDRSNLSIYDLQAKNNNKILEQSLFSNTLPTEYETILAVHIDEHDIDHSKIACKRKDHKNIDVISIKYIKEYLLILKEQGKYVLNKQEHQDLTIMHKVHSIRLNSFDLANQITRFSADGKHLIHTGNEQSLTLEFKDANKKALQKAINHLDEGGVMQIGRLNSSEFIAITAAALDSKIVIKHSSDQSKQVVMKMRYMQGSSQIKDIISFGKTIKILIIRDDQEFYVYEINDFKTIASQTKFSESSLISFEWPYVAYLMGSKHIIIQNTFNPKKSIYIEMSELKKYDFVSHLHMSDTLQLYIGVTTESEYLLYEKDLDQAVRFILSPDENDQRYETVRTLEDFGDSESAQKDIKSILKQSFLMKQQKEPICKITKASLNGKYLQKYFIRSSSSKETIQLNQERLIFFQSDFKIYSYNGVVDQHNPISATYKLRKLNPNFYIFQAFDEDNNKTNLIKYLKLAYSDYSIGTFYDEVEGTVEDILIQEGQMLCLIKPNSSENQSARLIKIFNIDAHNKVSYQNQLEVTDPRIIGGFITTDSYANNIIAFQNTACILIQQGKKHQFQIFEKIIPLAPNDQILFISPIFNQTYRKIMYLKANKSELSNKTCYVLPYLNDNNITFNIRNNMTQINNWHEYENQITKATTTTILTITPYTQLALLYSTKGQMIEKKNLKKAYQECGSKILTSSPNGCIFLQTDEETIDINQIFLVRVTPEYPSQNIGFDEFQEDIPYIKIQLMEPAIDFSSFTLDEYYQNDKNQYTLFQILATYQKTPGNEIVFKINDEFDILIGVVWTSPSKKKLSALPPVLKELFLLKKFGSKRSIFKIRLLDAQMPQAAQDIQEKKPANQTSLIFDQLGSARQAEQNNYLSDCFDFFIIENRIIVWSKTNIFHNDIDVVNSINRTINLSRSVFEIKNNEHYQEAAEIVSITSIGASEADIRMGNFYAVIKIMMDTYAYFVRYNLKKEKEFAAYDCDPMAECFFDEEKNSYILDADFILDLKQGVPLYFYKAGMRSIDRQYLFSKSIDKGPRFCSDFKNSKFLIRNKYYLPYSYYSLMLLQKNKNKEMSVENYDPNSYFCLDGTTSLHRAASDFKLLSFQLDQFEKSNPQLINMLLLNNPDEKNVLELAMDSQSQRCVNLILDKLSKLSKNNIHQLKKNFADLLEFNYFEQYLSLCFFQTNQMKTRTVMRLKNFDQEAGVEIKAHTTSFLDKTFCDKFIADSGDKDVQPIPVEIRSLDAGWIFKSKEGDEFLLKLSQSENMNYFQIDLVRILIMFQWNYFKPKIIKFLFIPFLLNLILFTLYALVTFEGAIGSFETFDNSTSNDTYNDTNPDPEVFYMKFSQQQYIIVNDAICMILLMFSFFTFFVEFKQLQFHKWGYFAGIWNLLDCSAAACTPTLIIMDLWFQIPAEVCRPIMAVLILIFYLRLFYFLRIFNNSSFYVRIIIEIIYDIRIFIMILFIGAMAFGFTFLILSNNSAAADQYTFSVPDSFTYSYQVVIGNFNIGTYDNTPNYILTWIIFILSTLFTTIILLNMMVAIMGDSFSRVTEQQENQMYREHLQLIVENGFLVNQNSAMIQSIKYLIAIKHDKDDYDSDEVLVAIQKMKASLKLRLDNNDKYMKEMTLMIEKSFQKLSKDQEKGFRQVNRDMEEIRNRGVLQQE